LRVNACIHAEICYGAVRVASSMVRHSPLVCGASPGIARQLLRELVKQLAPSLLSHLRTIPAREGCFSIGREPPIVSG
jgi:hypothetical protein